MADKKPEEKLTKIDLFSEQEQPNKDKQVKKDELNQVAENIVAEKATKNDPKLNFQNQNPNAKTTEDFVKTPKVEQKLAYKKLKQEQKLEKKKNSHLSYTYKSPYLRVSAFKARLFVKPLINLKLDYAVDFLQTYPNKGARFLLEILKNFKNRILKENQFNLESPAQISDYYVNEILINEGPTYKRFQPHGRGRAFKILKRTSIFFVKISLEKKMSAKQIKMQKLLQTKDKTARETN